MEASRKSHSEEPLTVYRCLGSAVLSLVWTFAVIQPVWSHQYEPTLETGTTASRPDVMCSEGSRLESAAGVSPDTGSAPSLPRDGVRFRAAALQVLVPVSVTDDTGRSVKGLHLQDFRVWEDGIEQPLERILTEETPLTLGVVVDVSGSMRSKMKQTVEALTHLLAALDENDRAFLLGFNGSVVTIQDLTCNVAKLPDALARFDPVGNTAMFDGVVEALYRLYKIDPETRRALILLSDGFDNASINTPRETAAAAKATGVPIYAVGLGKNHRGFLSKIFADPVDRNLGGVDENRLRALAESTGGRAFILDDIERHGKRSSLTTAFERMGREVRSHYLLSYSAPRSELDGRWHSLRVELSRPDLLARFRPGYLALPLE